MVVFRKMKKISNEINMPKEADNEDFYCGAKKVPKGKKRGSPEYCLNSKQVRYYGIEALSKDLIDSIVNKTFILIKEQLKLKKYEDTAKRILKDYKNIQMILEGETFKKAAKKKAEKDKEKLLKRRDRLMKQYKVQKALVQRLEKEEDDKNKKLKKKLKKK